MPFDIKTQLRIQYESPSGTWNSIQADSFELEIDRGIDVESGVLAKPSVGIATVKMMKSSLADFINGPAYQSNQRIRIEWQNISTWQPLFYGFIQNIEMSYVPTAKVSGNSNERGKLQVTITANDMGRIALNTLISSMIVGSTTASRGFRAVMDQLETAITAIDSRYTQSQFGSTSSSTYQYAGEIFGPQTAGSIYDQLLDAELGWLWASPFSSGGMLYMTRGDVATQKGMSWDPSTRVVVSNVHSLSDLHSCMDNIQLDYNSDGITNIVRIENQATPGTYTTVTNSTSVTAYGRQVGEFGVKFNPTSPSSTLTDWGNAVTGAANPKAITQVSVPVLSDLGVPSLILNRDVGEPLQVEFAVNGLTTLQEQYLMTRHNHVITADHWEMNIGLWRGI
jgi:hypothetical protein